MHNVDSISSTLAQRWASVFMLVSADSYVPMQGKCLMKQENL